MTTMQRFYLSGVPLGEREVGVVVVSSPAQQPARDGHVLDPAGVDLSNYRKNPVVLYSHTPENIVGTATAIGVRDGVLAARIAFAPEGISALADQCCSLVKAGVLRGISCGFDILDATPLDKNQPRGGLRISRSELLEISVVAIPADVGAGVVERSAAWSVRFPFNTLRPVPTAAIQRAAARVQRRKDGLIMPPASHVARLLEARQRYRQDDRADRLREIERLRARGFELGIAESRAARPARLARPRARPLVGLA